MFPPSWFGGVTKYNSQIIKNKYVICNRGGKDKPKPCDTLATSSFKRKPNSKKIITECTSKIVFENVYGTTNCKAKQFFELHNHPAEIRASKAKIGPTMAHRIREVLIGGYGYAGAKFLHDGDQLAAMFWSDKRENAFYVEFGEVISFDATFRTNKYKMVFVPFTAIDHHKKSVIVGTGLLSRERNDSYEWLLKSFLIAHEGKAPKIVLTDQDPTIKQAMESGYQIQDTNYACDT
uniref:MULE transposase domain-containing protein n=1 Tax=Lactuca sativa TaxID=4236 RepID=A0A9R1WWR9_LACSA|nr:hypothetical protein LSAT_V11C800405080 [Lactuca sativa]